MRCFFFLVCRPYWIGVLVFTLPSMKKKTFIRHIHLKWNVKHMPLSILLNFCDLSASVFIVKHMQWRVKLLFLVYLVSFSESPKDYLRSSKQLNRRAWIFKGVRFLNSLLWNTCIEGTFIFPACSQQGLDIYLNTWFVFSLVVFFFIIIFFSQWIAHLCDLWLSLFFLNVLNREIKNLKQTIYAYLDCFLGTLSSFVFVSRFWLSLSKI